MPEKRLQRTRIAYLPEWLNLEIEAELRSLPRDIARFVSYQTSTDAWIDEAHRYIAQVEADNQANAK